MPFISVFSSIILFLVALVAVDPGVSFEEARDSERKSEITQISNALTQWQVDGGDLATIKQNNGFYIPDCVSGLLVGADIVTTKSITSGVYLNDILVGIYLPSLPTDPSTGINGNTGYDICRTSTNQLQISAPDYELAPLSIVR